MSQTTEQQTDVAAMVDDIVGREANFVPSENPGALERFGRSLVNDPRDVPFLGLMAQITLVVIPFAVLLFVPGVFRWWLAPLYWAVVFLGFVDRYILMLHNTSHRPLFKKRYALANHYIPWVLGPFMGETPETYFAHHIGMHHIEDNLEGDLSSTMRFQRDSIVDFLRYFFRFFFFGMFELSAYFVKKRRPARARRMLFGELSFIAMCVALSFVSVPATLVVFVIPVITVRFLMMAGNWGQHAFVDPAAPNNNYRNSVTCVDSRYNRRCWNDGYHIGHHLSAIRHWTEMPVEFRKNFAKYHEERALVFRGTDNFGVWLSLMTRSYKTLAKQYVHLGPGPKPSEAELTALFKSRLAPIVRDRAVDSPASAQAA